MAGQTPNNFSPFSKMIAPEQTEAASVDAEEAGKRRRLCLGESRGGTHIRRLSSAPQPPSAGGAFASLEGVVGGASLLAKLERHANEVAALATLARGTLSDKLKEEQKEEEHRELVDGMRHRLAVLSVDVHMLKERRGRTIAERSLEDALEANAKLTRRVDTLRQSLRESITRSFDNALAQARLACPALDEADLFDLDPFKTVVNGEVREVEVSSSDEEAVSAGGLGGKWRP